MPTLIHLSCNAYRVLFLCCPSDLGSRFAAKICDVFAEQLCCEWPRRGLRGFACVWSTALCERLTVAAPRRLQSPFVIAVAISLLGSVALCSAFLRGVSTP
jgi:hypothetical protein